MGLWVVVGAGYNIDIRMISVLILRPVKRRSG